jgi:hypothetical protein
LLGVNFSATSSGNGFLTFGSTARVFGIALDLLMAMIVYVRLTAANIASSGTQAKSLPSAKSPVSALR